MDLYFSMLVAAMALLLLRGTPESRSDGARRHKLDIGGLVSFVLMLVLLNLFISKGHGWGWSSGLSLLVLGAPRWQRPALCSPGDARVTRR